jgi:hypothetical protein
LSLALLTTAALALIALGLFGLAARAYGWRGRRAPGAAREPLPNPVVGDLAKLENYQLILDTLDRSNVLLWWARVKKVGDEMQWNIRTPPQLKDNPIYRLAALVE